MVVSLNQFVSEMNSLWGKVGSCIPVLREGCKDKTAVTEGQGRKYVVHKEGFEQ